MWQRKLETNQRPVKQNKLSHLGQALKIYQEEAALRRVAVKAFFVRGIPQNVIDFAIKKLGSDKVIIFK